MNFSSSLLPPAANQLQINPKMKPTQSVGLGNKPPTIDKFIQVLGIVLLFLIDLCGSECIFGKKCALTTLKTRQQNVLKQMR